MVKIGLTAPAGPIIGGVSLLLVVIGRGLR
jgi:hypothetical protein